MAELVDLAISGLYTHPNIWGSVPKGALLEAKNIVITRENVAESRRGFNNYGPALTNVPNSVFSFNDTLIIHHGTKLAVETWSGDPLELSWTDLGGDFSPPVGTSKLHKSFSNQNFYFTSDEGVYCLDSPSNSPSLAGGLKALGGEPTLDGVSGFLTDTNTVAYRVVWSYKDFNGNVTYGTPSERILVTNNVGAGDTRNVSINVYLPDDVTLIHTCRLYRSDQFDSGIEPDDELQFSTSATPTATDITNGYITIVDTIPDGLRDETIYTAASIGDGMIISNEPPPFARDIDVYNDRMFYGNTRTKHFFNMSLTGVGAPTGLQNGDTITIDGVVFTGAAAENTAAAEFLISVGGSVSANIEATARSLVRVINQHNSAPSVSVYAFYVSGYDDLPGKIFLESKTQTDTAFAIVASRGEVWSPVLTTEDTSDNEVKPARLYFSKQGQPESVPRVQYIDVGRQDEPIIRVIALRDFLFVFKTDGIFRISGDNNFSSTLVETTRIVAPESAVVLQNQIFLMSEQGVLSVTNAGVDIISRSIEIDLIKLTGAGYTNFESATFGVGYESERSYILYTVTNEEDTYATQAYVYNLITQSWTTWEQTKSGGFVNIYDDNKMYILDPESNFIQQERKSFTLKDYADEEWPINIESFTGTSLILTDASKVVVNDIIEQGAGSERKVTKVINNFNIEVNEAYEWDLTGAPQPQVTLFKSIPIAIRTVPMHADNPGVEKFWREMLIFFLGVLSVSDVTITWRARNAEESTTYNIQELITEQYGGVIYGAGEYGGDSTEVAKLNNIFFSIEPVRLDFPQSCSRNEAVSIRIEHSEAFKSFGFAGLSFVFDYVTEKIN